MGVCGADPHSLALQASATTVSAKPPIVFHVDEIYWEFRQRYSRFICFLNRVIFSKYFILVNHYSFYLFYLWCPVDSNHFSWICSIGWTRTTDSRFYQLNYYRVWFTVYSVFSPVHIPYLPEHQVFMSGWQDSNLRPRGPKPCVLPTELHPEN